MTMTSSKQPKPMIRIYQLICPEPGCDWLRSTIVNPDTDDGSLTTDFIRHWGTAHRPDPIVQEWDVEVDTA